MAMQSGADRTPRGVQMAVLLVVHILLVIGISGASDHITYTMEEERPPGSRVGNIKQNSSVVRSIPASALKDLRFGLLPGRYQTLMNIDRYSGALSLNTTLDRDTLCPGALECILTLEASVTWPPEDLTVLPIKVVLQDINDNSPRFSRPRVSLSISEAAPPGSRYLLPMAIDPDSAQHGIQTYRKVSNDPTFDLDPDTSAGGPSLILRGGVDRESQSSYVIQIAASDGRPVTSDSVLTIDVTVVDANDNSPQFLSSVYNVTLQEDQKPDTPFLMIRAVDPDEGANGDVVYSLAAQTADSLGSLFRLDPDSGALSLKRPLDYQMGDRYILIITARDQGQDTQQSHAQVFVKVKDTNNHPPTITASPVVAGSPIGVLENLAPGVIAAIVSVGDPDLGEGGRCACDVTDSAFDLLPLYQNGYKIVTRKSLDREERMSYSVLIECWDSGYPPLRSRQTVHIEVVDTNDHAPVFSRTHYVTNITEGQQRALTLLHVNASDRDSGENARVTYRMDPDAEGLLDIDEATGVITSKVAFDYESLRTYSFRVYATDQGFVPRTATASVRIHVDDVNDESPAFSQASYQYGTFENQANGTEVGTVLASDADSHPFNVFTFSLSGPADTLAALAVHPQLGRITTRRVLDREAQAEYRFSVVATDTAPPYLSASASVTVCVADRNDNAPYLIFPNPRNDSIEISARTPLNHVIARIEAQDADIGSNAKLEFRQDYRGLGAPPVAVDPISGEVFVQADLTQLYNDVIDIHILISDRGTPPMTSSGTLHVTVNQTLAFLGGGRAAGTEGVSPGLGGPLLSLGYHERIILILGSVTGVLVVLLVAAIVLVKRRQLRHAKDNSYCHVGRAQYGHKAHAHAHAAPDVTTDCLPSEDVERKVGVLTFRKPSKFDEAQPEDLVKPPPEQDSDSGCSADVSNADSGQGPSEEGEHPGGCPVHPRPPGRPPRPPRVSSVLRGSAPAPACPLHRNNLTPSYPGTQGLAQPSRLETFSPQRHHGNLNIPVHKASPRGTTGADKGVTKAAPQVAHPNRAYLPHLELPSKLSYSGDALWTPNTPNGTLDRKPNSPSTECVIIARDDLQSVDV